MVSNADAVSGAWCAKEITEDAEIDNDWVIIDSEKKAYDANLFVLTANFKRDLIGSSNKDFTYKIGKQYDYILTFGIWESAQTSGVATIQASESSTLVTSATRTYSPVSVMTASYDDTFAQYLAGVTTASALIVAASLF